MPSSDLSPLRDWAASGAMALTGRPTGAPLAAPGDAAGQVRRALAEVGRSTQQRTGRVPDLPDVRLLGERAAATGFSRNGPWSCGGAFRTLRAGDGWLGLSLPRDTDRQLVPALVEAEVAGDPWSAVADWAARRTASEAADRARLLGLAAAALPGPGSGAFDERRAPVVVTRGPNRDRVGERPRVVDLTSLWAGPLCAHLLGLGGAEVVKVESTDRPDGTRSGPRAFLDLLQGSSLMVSLDLRASSDLARLRRLVASADLVLEASRPRALRQLGLVAEDVVAAGTSWLSITAYGRGREWIGFGDDVAAGAGLVVEDDGEPLPCGDALADPVAGVTAAAAAAEALLDDRACLVDVSMHHVAASTLAARPGAHTVLARDGEWWVESEEGEFRVLPPQARRPERSARAQGFDNERLLG